MPRSCTICTHPNTAEISKAIMAGGSKRTLAVRFGVNDASIQRHRTICLQAAPRQNRSGATSKPSSDPEKVRFENDTAAISSPSDLLGRLKSLFRLGDLLEEAVERRDIDACVKLAREYRAAAESYAKVAGWMTEGAVINVDARRQSVELFGKLTENELRALARTRMPDATDSAAAGSVVTSIEAKRAERLTDAVESSETAPATPPITES